MSFPTPQEMLIVMLNDEYSLTGLKAPPEATGWTEAQIQKFFDSGGKMRPTVVQASAAKAEEEQGKQATEEEALRTEVARGTPFGVLGVPRKSTRDEVRPNTPHSKLWLIVLFAAVVQIKKVYRKLAMQYHPDRNQGPGQDEAGEKFRRIAEAWDILGDVDKRAQYEFDGKGWMDNSQARMQFQRANQMFTDLMGFEEYVGDGHKVGEPDWWERFDARQRY